MAPVVDKPTIQHIFELLATHGVEEVHVNVHHLADTILDFYAEETRVDGMAVNFSREGNSWARLTAYSALPPASTRPSWLSWATPSPTWT